MERLVLAASVTAALALPCVAIAQTPTPVGNNPTTAGVYMGVALGVSVLDDTDFEDTSNGAEATAESDAGLYGDLSVGYTIPLGTISIRTEGELAGRTNAVDEFQDGEAVENSDISSFAGMANAYADFYILPNMALSVGAGLGYATVQVDIASDVNGVDVLFFDEETDSGFAYQGLLGARYDFAGGSTIELGYSYFAVNDLTVEIASNGEDADFDYLSHSFNVGYVYRF